MPRLTTVKVQYESKIKIYGQNLVYGEDLRSQTLKTKIWGNNHLSRRFGKYSFQKARTQIGDFLALPCWLSQFNFACSLLKGVFSKPSGNCIVVPNFCLLSQRLQILATCLFFNFAELCKVWAKSNKVDISHFIRVPPLMFFDSIDLPKIQRGDPYKMTIINFV